MSELELFYFPISYYSQKAYLALYEKNLSFKKRYVYIHFGEQNEEWYLRLNPNGEVPTLKDGSDVIYGSEEIIDYVDRKTDNGACLVPDIATPLGRRVAEIRKWLSDIPVGVVTYGVLLHPCLQVKSVDFLQQMGKKMNIESYEKSTKASLADFRERQKACPDLHDAIAKKIEATQLRLDNLLDEQRVKGILDGLQQTFDQIQRELEQSQKESGTGEGWMCGATFTATDVVMAILFNRLTLIGIDGEYYSASKRPLVLAYRDRLYNRPAVQRLLEESSSEVGMKLMRQKVMKDVSKKVVKVAVVAGIVAAVAYGVKEYIGRK